LTLMLLLGGGVVLEGVVSLLPHDHAADVPPRPTECENQGCSAPEDAHLQNETRTAATSPCLACATANITFDQTPIDGVVASTHLTSPAPAANPLLDPPARRWHPLLRAPPRLI
jgi:hypothetical protein